MGRGLRALALGLVLWGLGPGAIAQENADGIQPPATFTQRQSADVATRVSPTVPIAADFLLDAIVTWLSANFELPAVYTHPKVNLVSAGDMALLRFGTAGSDGGRRAVGIYVDSLKTIFLREGWTGRTPAELSVLVHELVHHLQHIDNRTYDCPEAREKLAYAAQERWLGLFGRSLLQDFEMDAMTLKVVTSCF